MAFQILSLSGGGFLGLYTAAVLSEIEKQTGRPITTSFDLLAGTSIGGIIALGLAKRVSAEDIKSSLEANGSKIFGNRPLPSTAIGEWLSLLRGVFSSKYDASALRTAIESIVGTDTRIGNLSHPVLVPAVNLSKGKPQIFKTPHHPDFKLDLHIPIVDVALATSAAPTYFPIAEINDSLFTDGGLYANSPDLLALHEAIHFFKIPEENIRILSIGTTTAQFSFAYTNKKRLGIARWFSSQRLMNVIIAAQQQSVDFMLRHRLKDRYLRLDSSQSKEQERILGLDVATNEAQKTIRALAAATVQDHINNTALTEMLSNTAPDPKFYHRLPD